ncbi:MAG: hypothetical protein L6R40_005345 [Gallowayella cf. fulva]|nr:MAG: hypothetical protein L6R40_005345 [Xanthomendoza cf. fulva]
MFLDKLSRADFTQFPLVKALSVLSLTSTPSPNNPPSKKREQMSTPSKPPTTLPATSTLHPLATTTGTHPLTLGPSTYIHPRAHLSTLHAPLRLGTHVIVCEKAFVGLLDPRTTTDDEGGEGGRGGVMEGGVIVEDAVIIEAGAVVEAARIGEGTVVEAGARLGVGVVVGKDCKINALCSVAPYDTVPDHTVIYGYDNARRVDRSGRDALRRTMVAEHVEVLRKAEVAARKK